MADRLAFRLDEVLLRIGLIGTALIVFNAASDVWNQGFAFRYSLSLELSLAMWGFGMACFGVALVRRVPRRAAWLVLVGLIAMLLVYGYLTIINYNPLFSPHTDNEMIAKFATETLERGANPYRWNFTDMLRVYRDPGHFTPFLNGSPQNRLTYPALPTLVLWAFDQVGLGEVRIMSTLAHLVLLILVFVKTPEWLRPVILMPLVVFRDYVPYALNGVQDIVWSLALIGVIYAWNRPTLRALLFGTACAFRQQPWFAAPFLLIYLWQEGGSRHDRLHRVVYFAGISVSVFMVVNLPFFVWDPAAWLHGAVEPSYAAFNYMSQSLGALTQYGIAPFPRLFYSLLQLSSLLIMVILYGFYARSIGQAFWIFPGLFFWTYYRGLSNYWMYWMPVLLVAIACNLDGRFSLPAPGTRRRTRHVIPLVLVSVILLVDGGIAAYYLNQDPSLSLAYAPPVEVIFGGKVNRLRITVTNHSQKTLTPRFAVQPETSIQAWPWHIETGPEQLSPGQTGHYVITAQTSSFKAFQVGWGGQVVVSDAGGDYTLRAVLTIPKQTGFSNPDLIANPDYRYWPQDGLAPLGWMLDAEPGSIATVSLSDRQGRSGLMLNVESNPHAEVRPVVRIEQMISFPDRFAIWVYPTATSTDPNDELYGLEITDDEHQLWVLFGNPASGGFLADNHGFVVIPAPMNEWSRQVIDLAGLYQSLGWSMPVSSIRYYNGLRYAVPQVRLSLIAGSRVQPVVTWKFGPIEQETGRYTTGTLMSTALEHPDTYYVTIGNEQRSQRNYHLAQAFHRTALAANASNSAAYFGLAESYFWSGEWDSAAAAFEEAITHGYPIPGLAYKGIGWAQYNLVHYEEALIAFDESVRLLTRGAGGENETRLADAYSGVGWSQLRLGDCEQASASFVKALELDPAHPTARSGLEECAAN